jgi:hypothetical protein
LGKIVVEPKTLGLGILSLEKKFKNDFENLGVVTTPLRRLQMIL